MTMTNDSMIAVCGLDCRKCNLFNAATDAQEAETLVGWFKQEGWLTEDEGAREIMQRGPYCAGCNGDPAIQWSEDCWIRRCCVEEKGLANCSECTRFPCQRLVERAKDNARYTAALERLQSLR